jgi:fibronectin-binding autotransporter adhesin
MTISMKITGGTTFRKTGAGVLVLGGVNTYAGATQVNGGTLLVNGNQSAANGPVSVSNFGTVLGGTGTIGGATTVNDQANITGGTNGTIGTLTLSSTSPLTFTGNSTYLVDINAATADKLAIGGLLDLRGGSDQIFFNALATPTAASYTLATYTGVLGVFDIEGYVPAGYTLVYGLTELDLVMIPVPEPSTWIAAALALGAIGFTQRRKLRRLFVIGS